MDSLADVLAKPYAYYGAIEDGHYDIGVSAAFGLASTVRDLATFDRALGSGALISDRNRNEMFTPFPTSTGISPYGLGIFSQVFLGKQIIWGYGQQDNFAGLLLKVPEDDVTLVLLANNPLMSDPPRLINGDITYSLFALSFLQHFVFDVSDDFHLMNVNVLEDADVTSIRGDDATFYRQELIANAIAASFMWSTDSTAVQRSKELVAFALETFPGYTGYGNQSLMILLSDLSRYGNLRDFDAAIETLGETLLEGNPVDLYVNQALGQHYNQVKDKEKALEHYQRITEADNVRPNWYTIEGLDFLGDYYKEQNPELARVYFQRIVDIGWNMGGLLDKAKKELGDGG